MLRLSLPIMIILLALAGCGETPTAEYYGMGIGAKLPGDVTEWEAGQLIPLDNGAGNMQIKKDKSLLFSDLLIPNPSVQSELELDVFVRSFSDAAFLPPQVITQEEYKGYQAKKIEATGGKGRFPADYRFVGYVFFAGGQLHIVIAGATLSSWESGGGKENVRSMLDSVEVK